MAGATGRSIIGGAGIGLGAPMFGTPGFCSGDGATGRMGAGDGIALGTGAFI